MPGQPVMGQPVIGQAGCFGKLPARGDFLLRGLPRSFADPWHDWLLDGLQASRAALGEGWMGRYLNAPIWRFVLEAGVCGPQAAAGVMMPSVDKAGRQFPLALAALLAPGRSAAGAESDAAWFEAAEELALSVLTHTLDVEAFVGSVAALSVPQPVSQPVPQPSAAAPFTGARWWTLGGEGVAEQGFTTAGLPPSASFVDFLTGRAKEEA
ncbi:type VI secretion system-associated protein TagF [Azospirillum ramasamyi]|uniref:Type VI secretion system-associated protein TagF n=1 Tax=Azospirillum ramasamyi TaxID=682998 RepID=A0A2U9SBM7_9PROT|nr:type VI secretion system-associated protein TagF [Azospirillum ramasamyi]AWU96237.1 type VI secretion system-associated protein TagF [Azospirillum ramasamyi]